MKRWVVYEKSTGVVKSVRSGVNFPPTNLRPDFDYLEIDQDAVLGLDSRVVDGALIQITPSNTKLVARVQRLIRSRRRVLLAQSDWTGLGDVELSGPDKVAWAQYRKALRDLPSTYENEVDPANIQWPIAPGSTP